MLLEIIFTILLVLLFFMAGINKISTFTKTVNTLSSKIIFSNLPKSISIIAIILTILIEIIAPIFIVIHSLYGNIYTLSKYSLITLLIFTFIITLIYHNPILDKSQTIAFMKNLSIIGGLGLAWCY